MIPDALDRPPRTKTQVVAPRSQSRAGDMRARSFKLRARAVLQPDYVAVVFRAEADRLDRLAVELEDGR